MRIASFASAFGASLMLVIACGGSDNSSAPPADAGRPAENVGQSCSAPSQCYSGLDASTVHGDVQCLTRVTGGYCTHLCTTDADCCAVPGECRTGFKEVCAPFESTGQMMCFLSCEAADISAAPDAGTLDDTTYCTTFAASSFSCRSTGGGSKNRKVCLPQ